MRAHEICALARLDANRAKCTRPRPHRIGVGIKATTDSELARQQSIQMQNAGQIFSRLAAGIGRQAASRGIGDAEGPDFGARGSRSRVAHRK